MELADEIRQALAGEPAVVAAGLDRRIVRDIVEHHTGNLQRFVDAIRARLA